MDIQQLQQQALALSYELKTLSNDEYEAQLVKCHHSPTFSIVYNGRGSERFQLWVSPSFTEHYQKRYLERNIVRLEQIKKDLFGEES